MGSTRRLSSLNLDCLHGMYNMRWRFPMIPLWHMRWELAASVVHARLGERLFRDASCLAYYLSRLHRNKIDPKACKFSDCKNIILDVLKSQLVELWK